MSGTASQRPSGHPIAGGTPRPAPRQSTGVSGILLLHNHQKENIMRNLGSKIAIAAIIGLGAVAANAAPVTAEAGAGAKIIAPLEIASTTDLYFGTIAPSLTEAGDVVVTPDGAKTCAAALTCLTSDHTAAAFEVRGESDIVYTISLPGKIDITSNKGDTMFVRDFSGSKSEGRLNKGKDDFTVGGTLDVGVRQAAGLYTGRFVVAVEYQ